jgi:amino acid transporter
MRIMVPLQRLKFSGALNEKYGPTSLFGAGLRGPLWVLGYSNTWFCTGNEWQFNQPKVRRMFSSIRKAKILIPFFYQRLGDYAELARLDLITFRNEMINSIVGAAIGAAALLLLLCFICVAVIVTEWDTPYRVRTAWLIALGWGLVTGACAYVARLLMTGSSPFENIGSEISRDLSVIRDPQDHTHDERHSP